jgi:hypothetical protein
MNKINPSYYINNITKLSPMDCLKGSKCVFNSRFINIHNKAINIIKTSQLDIDLACYNFIQQKNKINIYMKTEYDYPYFLGKYPCYISKCIFTGCSVDFLQTLFQHIEELEGIEKIKSCINWLLWDAIKENKVNIVNFLINWGLEQERKQIDDDIYNNHRLIFTCDNIAEITYAAVKNKNCQLLNTICNYIINTNFIKKIVKKPEHFYSDYICRCNGREDPHVLENKFIKYSMLHKLIIDNTNQQELLIKSLLLIAIANTNDYSVIKFDLEQAAALRILDTKASEVLMSNLNCLKLAKQPLNKYSVTPLSTINLFNLSFNSIANTIARNNINDLPKKLFHLKEFYPPLLTAKIIREVYAIKLGFRLLVK